MYPGLKGLKEMLGTVPAWIHYEERERVEVRPALAILACDGARAGSSIAQTYSEHQLQNFPDDTMLSGRPVVSCEPSIPDPNITSLQWLNSVLTQMWPFYDPAICAAVKVQNCMHC